jgi:2'-hydroxyisoflavone reductase
MKGYHDEGFHTTLKMISPLRVRTLCGAKKPRVVQWTPMRRPAARRTREMKKALILGGSYFVGRVFVEELLEAGTHEVYVLNRGNIPMRKDAVRELKCDRHDENGMNEVLPDVAWDAVVDFCAYAPADIEIALRALAARGGVVRHYVYISTASVYAKTSELPVFEEAAKLDGPQPELGPFADYAFDKWRAEQALERECRAGKIPFTILRPAFIYGKYNYAPRENYLARITVGVMGNERAVGRAFNAAAGDLVSYDRFLEVLEHVTGRKAVTARMSVEQINRENVPLPFPLDEHLVYSGKSVADVLGFRYTPFAEGMKETYRYYLRGRKT